MDTRPQTETARLLAICLSLLSDGNFSTCRNYAFRVPRSDPETSTAVDRVLAITDVLLAANRRYDNQYDWYSILQVTREDAENSQLMKDQFEKLLLLLMPTKNMFPFSAEALSLVRQAWAVLSKPGKRAQYEKVIDNAKERTCKQRQEVEDTCKDDDKVEGADPDVTFWTICPYCWVLYEYEKDYVGCCLVCHNCNRIFHGVELNPPLPGMLVDGKEQYSCCYAYFALRYSKFPNAGLNKNSNMTDVKGKGMMDEKLDEPYVEISDDEEDDSNGHQYMKQDKDLNLKEDGLDKRGQVQGLNEKGRTNVNERTEDHNDMQRNATKLTELNGKRGMRVKIVPLYSSKIVGNKRRNLKNASRNYYNDDDDEKEDGDDGEK